MLARDYGVPFLGEIPLDPRIGAAADAGTPVAAVGDDGLQIDLRRTRLPDLGSRSTTTKERDHDHPVDPRAGRSPLPCFRTPTARAGDAPAKTPELVEKGKASFAKNCVACHGKGGEGDGPAAKALKPPPENLVTHPMKGGAPAVFDVLGKGVKGTGMIALQAPPRGGALGARVLRRRARAAGQVGGDRVVQADPSVTRCARKSRSFSVKSC